MVVAGLVLAVSAASPAALGGEDPGRVVDRLFEAYRSGSVEGMLEVYARDAVFEDVNQRHGAKGEEELRSLLSQIVGLHSEMDLQETRRARMKNTIVVEYEYRGSLSGAALGQALGKEGCPDIDYVIPTTSWYEVRDGRIQRQRDFLDLATLQELRQKAAAASAGEPSGS
jgi:ketosteroid isomerase-like protein